MRSGARALPGVAAVVTGEDMAPVCSGWVGTLAHFAGMKSATQRPLATGKASWQGEPVAAVVAESRAIAEDGVARVRVEWEALPAVTDPESALDPSTPVIHPELGDNLAFRLDLASGDADAPSRRPTPSSARPSPWVATPGSPSRRGPSSPISTPRSGG